MSKKSEEALNALILLPQKPTQSRTIPETLS